MRHFPYPITVRILNGYIEVQVPDFGLIRAKKRWDDLKKAKDLGDLILGVIQEVTDICNSQKRKPLPVPSKPRGAFEIETADLLTTQDVQRILQVSHETVRRLSNQGTLESFRTTGGHRRFKRTEVEQMLLERRKLTSKRRK